MAPSAQYQQYHLFSLPSELLSTLTERTLVQPTPETDPIVESVTSQTGGGGTSLTGKSCGICLGVIFDDVDLQRKHYRSDWHRYNVKLKLKGGKTVTEEHFAQLIDGLEDSISGSESSSEDDESDEDDKVDSLFNKHHTAEYEDGNNTLTKKIPQSPIIWFTSSEQTTQIGVYRSIFPIPSLGPSSPSFREQLTALQTPDAEQPRTWAMFMVAGGHFAGAIISVSKSLDEREVEVKENENRARKGKPKRMKSEIEVLRHKTFHRYTTRRKQGGSQSINDNAKGNAKSAGAQLRRYGEQALREDIRNLLEEWKEDLEECELIWLRGTGSNRKTFMDYEGCVITKHDKRLRGFPFPTRRPTQAELTRCLNELIKPKTSHLTEDVLMARDEAYLASIKPAPAPPPPPPKKDIDKAAKEKEKPKFTKDQLNQKEKWEKMVEMIDKGRVESARMFWGKEKGVLSLSLDPEPVISTEMGAGREIDTRIPSFVTLPNQKGSCRWTMLMFAASCGQDEIVKWLLEEERADPTLEVEYGGNIQVEEDELVREESDGVGQEKKEDDPQAHSLKTKGKSQTAYSLITSRTTRDIFRRCASDHSDWWDWFGSGQVPSGLTKEMEDKRKEKEEKRREKEKQRGGGLKEKIRLRQEKERMEAELASKEEKKKKNGEKQEEPGTGMPRKLGGASGDGGSLVGLTAEMRMKIERERRARAAEARLRQ